MKRCLHVTWLEYDGHWLFVLIPFLRTSPPRLSPDMLSNPLLNGSRTTDVLYLDNTYCHPSCTFPTRVSGLGLLKLIAEHLGMRQLICAHGATMPASACIYIYIHVYAGHKMGDIVVSGHEMLFAPRLHVMTFILRLVQALPCAQGEVTTNVEA